MTLDIVAAKAQGEMPAWVRTLLSLGGTLVAMSVLVWALGASPIQVVKSIAVGALGNSFNIGQTIVTTGILVATALAAAIPFSARLWNVGGEGQMTVGAIAAAVLGIVLSETWSRWVLVPLVMIGSMAAGALFGALPGWLKARFDASEVVTTLMLNFVAASGAAWIIFEVYPEGFVQRTESIHAGAELTRPIEGSLIDIGILVALAAAVIAWFVIDGPERRPLADLRPPRLGRALRFDSRRRLRRAVRAGSSSREPSSGLRPTPWHPRPAMRRPLRRWPGRGSRSEPASCRSVCHRRTMAVKRLQCESRTDWDLNSGRG